MAPDSLANLTMFETSLVHFYRELGVCPTEQVIDQFKVIMWGVALERGTFLVLIMRGVTKR